MHAAHATGRAKHCCTCHKNVAGRWRTKNQAGQYFCRSCFENLSVTVRFARERTLAPSPSDTHTTVPFRTLSSSHSWSNRRHCKKCLTDVSKTWCIENSEGKYLCEHCHAKTPLLSQEEGIRRDPDIIQSRDFVG
ncbi:MAG TPA: hypothetical protein VMG59_04305 [Phycisphaerae bacterium]|nr:hypothetical protein [Phycisphaerae bacterium]